MPPLTPTPPTPASPTPSPASTLSTPAAPPLSPQIPALPRLLRDMSPPLTTEERDRARVALMHGLEPFVVLDVIKIQRRLALTRLALAQAI